MDLSMRHVRVDMEQNLNLPYIFVHVHDYYIFAKTESEEVTSPPFLLNPVEAATCFGRRMSVKSMNIFGRLVTI